MRVNGPSYRGQPKLGDTALADSKYEQFCRVIPTQDTDQAEPGLCRSLIDVQP